MNLKQALIRGYSCLPLRWGMRTVATPTSTMYNNCVSTLCISPPPLGPSHVGLCASRRSPTLPAGLCVPCWSAALCPGPGTTPGLCRVRPLFDHLLTLCHSRRAHWRLFTLGDPIYDFGRTSLEGGRDPVHPCVVESCRCRCVAYR
jgi:hypothetical protein